MFSVQLAYISTRFSSRIRGMLQLEGSSHYWVHSLYKGHLTTVDNLAWFHGVRNSEVPLYYDKCSWNFSEGGGGTQPIPWFPTL